ncbi:hypothetical protein [Nocardia wallacei]|uniref:hypothetical protein n=1 Tax=Nocardia wallacei TaxID=480035 RepID=UPI002458F0AE|nr:hypothetical protein [Nocardia wallacei]
MLPDEADRPPGVLDGHMGLPPDVVHGVHGLPPTEEVLVGDGRGQHPVTQHEGGDALGGKAFRESPCLCR